MLYGLRKSSITSLITIHCLTDGRPFAVHTETIDSPWQPEAKLIKIGIQAQDTAKKDLPPANLVFLVDVSGSMDEENNFRWFKKRCGS